MQEETINDLQEYDIDFDIIEKGFNDIINEIDFKTEEDKLMCETIINHIENSIAINLKDMKIVQLPYIGTLTINPVKKEIKSHKKEFKEARKLMSKEEYKTYIKNHINNFRKKIEDNKIKQLYIKRIKSINKNKYNIICKLKGKSYGELYIYAISLLNPIPYDKEWEEHYLSLKE